MATMRTPSTGRNRTSAYSPARPAGRPHRHDHGSGCGCGEVEEPTGPICCDLDCLVQPRFFCGQLLTDEDLTTLLTWTKDKLRLGRFRDGWGVVCGFDVHCDPSNPTAVTVGPGYAVSCCGDDIVLCAEKPLDLSGACRPEGDPCAEPRLDPYTERRGVVANPVLRASRGATAAERERARYEGRYLDDDGGEDDGPELPGCPDDWCAVDLYVRYASVLTQPQSALRRGACDQLGRCEYSRIKEGAELYWAPASDPWEARLAAWLAGYDRCADLLERFGGEQTAALRTRGDDSGGWWDDVKPWLLSWLRNHSPHQFCFLHDEICRLDENDVTQETVGRFLLWLVQDCRNAFLQRGCPSCDESEGVRLARAYLVPGEATAGGNRVAYVDPYPPYRREHGADDRWPAAPGEWNFGGLIWHRCEEGCTALSERGIKASVRQVPLADGYEVSRILRCRPIVPCDADEVTVYCTPFCDGSDRIVAICAEDGPMDDDQPEEPEEPEREEPHFLTEAAPVTGEETGIVLASGEPASKAAKGAKGKARGSRASAARSER